MPGVFSKGADDVLSGQDHNAHLIHADLKPKKLSAVERHKNLLVKNGAIGRAQAKIKKAKNLSRDRVPK